MTFVPHHLTRRDVVAGSFAAMPGLLLSDSVGVAAAVPKSLPRIGILGAGLADLACGYELSAAGFSVDVFEARNRLGGRVHSVQNFAPKTMVEYGAELIGSNHPHWMKYAKEFEIELKLLVGEEEDPDLILQGVRYTGESARRLREEIERGHDELARDAETANWNEPWNTPDAERFDRTSLADRIAAMKTTDRAKQCLST